MGLSSSATDLVGPKPPAPVRAVSLAVRAYLREHTPDALVVGVSGGADSLALAVTALDLAARQGVPVSPITVDHGIRAESAGEAAGVVQLLRDLGAERARVVRPEPSGEWTGPEGEARDRRHRSLRQAALELQAETGADTVDILLGHTLDDQAETVLLRLARGSGARSLGAMARRTQLAPGLFLGRPLLDLRRADTVACCQSLGLEPVEDPTNRVDSHWRTAADEPLRRAAVRAWALPALERALGQDVAPALARTARQLQDDEQALTELADAQVARLQTRSADGHRLIPVAPTRALPAAIRRRLYRQLALECGAVAGELASVHLENVDRLVTNWHGQGPTWLPGAVRVRRRGSGLEFAPSTLWANEDAQ